MVLVSMNAFAGNEKGNGGGIHFCQADETQELYDIYEGQARYGFTIRSSNLTVDAQVNKAIEKIKKANPYIGKEVEKQVSYLRSNHMIIRARVTLAPVGDAKILLVDQGCAYKQLANWDEVSGNLIVSKDYFDRMDNTNKAALYVHEALYKVGRVLNLLPIEEDGTTTSDTIRRMVGEIFSTSESLNQLWDIVDPQIEIDRQAELNYLEVKRVQALEASCLKAAEEYNKLAANVVEKVKNKDCKSINGETYITTYFNKLEICRSNSDAAGRYSNEKIKSIVQEISSIHEDVMSGVFSTCK